MGKGYSELVLPQGKRCAIYTRKSTEEGLDQEFNSLDAQREACAAYILSQRHEGWTLVPDHFDDGGYSGGNMERPGLKQLLAEVRGGRIDVIVVYKVDRLTRALSDFAKIVEILDEAAASFVSITQAFNTTTSMGRLTLNVLLSFAQFEREVIGERVRDKVAASKRKGMWMGGCVPLGYEVRERKLIARPDEAEIVRDVFQRYVAVGSVPLLLSELREEGITTSRSGKSEAMSRGGLYHILSNRIYRGQTVHKGEVYPGEHEAIVSERLWDQAQACLASNRIKRRTGSNAADPSLLAGMLKDADGRRLAPSRSHKGSLRYRYYVSATLSDAAPTALRLPALPIERAVRKAIDLLLADERGLIDFLPEGVSAERSQQMLQTARELRSTISASVSQTRGLLLDLDLKAEIKTHGIAGTIALARLLAKLGVPLDGNTGARLPLTIECTLTEQKRGIRMVVEPNESGSPKVRDGRLIELLLRARDAYQQVVQGRHRVKGAADQRSKYLVRLARLNFLAPDIVEAILEGRQPASLNARRLSRIGDLPLSWNEQRRLLGFA